jgi:hypothetical protein
MATGANSGRFTQHTIAVLLLITGAIAIGKFWSETSECWRWPRANEFAPTCAKPFGYWIARDYQSTASAPDIVVFGDSQLGGLRSADAKVAGTKLDFALDHRSYTIESQLNHNGGELKTFIISQPGSLVSDYLVIAESLFSDLRKPERVILTVTPRAFLGNGLPFPGRSEYYRYFSSSVPLGAMYELAFPTVESRLYAVFQSMVRAPIPTMAPGQFLFLPDDKQVFNDKIKMYPDDCVYTIDDCQHQMRFLGETLRYLHSQEIEASVVSMPMLKCRNAEALRKLQPELSSEIKGLCKKYEATYLDLTDDNSFSRNDFLDPIHLSQSGGEKIAMVFSSFLRNTIMTEASRRRTLND